MSCSNSRWTNPAQVFAQFTTGSDKGEGNASPSKERNTTDHGRAEHIAGNREIQVTETGEVSLAPDKARVSVFCTMTKVKIDLFVRPYSLLSASYASRYTVSESGV